MAIRKWECLIETVAFKPDPKRIGGFGDILVSIKTWYPNKRIYIPAYRIPDSVRITLKHSPFFMAKVNVGAHFASQLDISDITPVGIPTTSLPEGIRERKPL